MKSVAACLVSLCFHAVHALPTHAPCRLLALYRPGVTRLVSLEISHELALLGPQSEAVEAAKIRKVMIERRRKEEKEGSHSPSSSVLSIETHQHEGLETFP